MSAVEKSSAARLIEPHKLGYTDLYLDFVAGREPARSFYRTDSFSEVAAELDAHTYDRPSIVEVLRRQNADFGVGVEAHNRINLLLQPDSLCVCSGQQAGLFTGPSLTLIKAMGIVKAAQLYSEQLNRPVVPVFWIAGDDHDFEEANHTFVLTRSGELCRNSYETKPYFELPTAEIELSDAEELARLKSQLRNCLGETEFTDELNALIDRCYRPGETLVSAFAKLMAELTSEFGLVFFNPGDAELKRFSIPFFRTIIEKQDQIHDLLILTNQRILDSGYHLQVEKKDNAVHLFYNNRGRRPLLREGDKFVAGEESFTKAELLDLIDRTPEKFSPDVMTRPLYQSYLFPVLSQKGGPSEIAYFAQLNPLFGALGLPQPIHKERPTATILERRTEQLMDDQKIAFEDLTGDIEQVINRVLAETFPENLEADFTNMREALERRFREFSDDALDFEPGMQKYAEQIRGKIDYLLKGFEHKLFAAHKKKSQQARERIYRLNNATYPHHGLQERTLNVTYFLARYGQGVLRHVFDRLDSEETAHQIITLAEYQQ